MNKNIKNIIKKIFFKLGLYNSLEKIDFHKNVNLLIHQSTLLQNFSIQLRQPKNDKIYLKIGENCLISGVYVFEIQSGKISIGNRTFIGGGTFICIEEIEIGDDVMISWGCTIADNNSHSHIWSERKNDVIDIVL